MSSGSPPPARTIAFTHVGPDVVSFVHLGINSANEISMSLLKTVESFSCIVEEIHQGHPWLHASDGSIVTYTGVGINSFGILISG